MVTADLRDVSAAMGALRSGVKPIGDDADRGPREKNK